MVATLAENTQVVHSRLVESLRPDNPLAQAPYLAAAFSLNTPGGMAALNAVFVAIAAMVAIAAVAVTRVGPEARGLSLDEIAPPTG